MNRLTTQDRARILTMLSEGIGVNAVCRANGASKKTVLKLLADVGQACFPVPRPDHAQSDHHAR